MGPPKADKISRPCGWEAGTAGVDNNAELVPGVRYRWEERDDCGLFIAAVCSEALECIASSSVVSSSERLPSCSACKSLRRDCRICGERYTDPEACSSELEESESGDLEKVATSLFTPTERIDMTKDILL